MKIEFESSIRSWFFVLSIRHQNCLDKSCWLQIPKTMLSSCRKLLYLSAGQTSTSLLMILWRYCKELKTYFGYFGHAWLHSPKMIVSTCRRLRCLLRCLQKLNFIIHLFLMILQFK